MSKNIIIEWAFKPGEVFIDTVFENGVNKFCTTTKEQYLNDGYVILSEDEAKKQIDEAIENKYFSSASIIDEDRYYDMMEVLPPLKMFKGCFMMCEKEINDITKAFVKIDNLYFELFVRTFWDYKTIINQLSALLLKQYKSICDSYDWDYEFHNVDDILNNEGSMLHLIEVVQKGLNK